MTSPSLSPVVLVKKRDVRVKFCADYKALNGKTYKESYPIPRKDQLLKKRDTLSVYVRISP